MSNHQSQLSKLEKIVKCALGSFRRVFPNTQNAVAVMAKQSPNNASRVVVVNAEVLLCLSFADSTLTVLGCKNTFVFIHRQIVVFFKILRSIAHLLLRSTAPLVLKLSVSFAGYGFARIGLCIVNPSVVAALLTFRCFPVEPADVIIKVSNRTCLLAARTPLLSFKRLITRLVSRLPLGCVLGNASLTPVGQAIPRRAIAVKLNDRLGRATLGAPLLFYNLLGQGVNLLRLGFVLARAVRAFPRPCGSLAF